MARKRTPIVLRKLSHKSAATLGSMVADLTGEEKADARQAAKPAPWSQRFAASGKFSPP